MREFKHTPGPWQVVRCNPSPTSGEIMIRGSKPGFLAEVRNCGSGDVGANAHLIAAAPDLLEALINLERVSGVASVRDDPARVAARAAIIKAIEIRSQP